MSFHVERPPLLLTQEVEKLLKLGLALGLHVARKTVRVDQLDKQRLILDDASRLQKVIGLHGALGKANADLKVHVGHCCVCLFGLG